MPGMPEAIARGFFLARFHDESQRDDDGKKRNAARVRARLTRFRAALKEEYAPGLPRYKLEDLAVEFRLCQKNDEQYQHLQAHWLNATTGWWSTMGLQPIEPILREGFITAFDAALEDQEHPAKPSRTRPLPIAIVWECRGHEVLVFVSWTKQQVSLVIHTPPPPPPFNQEDPAATVEDALFIVSKDASGKVVRKRPKYKPFTH